MAQYNREHHRSEAFQVGLAREGQPKLTTTITLDADRTASVQKYLDDWAAHFESLGRQSEEEQDNTSDESLSS
jgi:hypothetical protein